MRRHYHDHHHPSHPSTTLNSNSSITRINSSLLDLNSMYRISLTHLFVTLVGCCIAFNLGFMSTLSVSTTTVSTSDVVSSSKNDRIIWNSQGEYSSNDPPCIPVPSSTVSRGSIVDTSATHTARIGKDLSDTTKKRRQERILRIVEERVQQELLQMNNTNTKNHKIVQRFDSSVSRMFAGMGRILKDEFVQKFDYGFPYAAGREGKKEVLLFYNKFALPSSHSNSKLKNTTTGSNPTNKMDDAYTIQYEVGQGIPLLNISHATDTCDILHVLTTDNPDKTQQCLAIVPAFENMHVQRWMRVEPPGTGAIDSVFPLRLTSRGYNPDGRQNFIPPDKVNIRKHFVFLKKYLANLETTKKDLNVILSQIHRNNAVIVLTCNMGQSELLINFVCNARAKGLHLENIILFPTDEETDYLGQSLGLATFYDKNMYLDNTPKKEARRYGDWSFSAMMYTKLITVHLVNSLGYHVLFQDVDIIWNRDPLPFFLNPSSTIRSESGSNSSSKSDEISQDFDMYFQDDGSRSIRYAPLCANSGFYFIRSNRRTKYFFTQFLYSGDQILWMDSHQQVFVQMMNEHMSLYALKVKVLDRDSYGFLFPGGYHFHYRRNFMKDIFSGKVQPFMFHMSWTSNKDNKIKFFQQMGEWHVQDQCGVKTFLEEEFKEVKPQSVMEQMCCLAEPNITCYYSDKPSKIQECKSSPKLDLTGTIFW